MAAAIDEGSIKVSVNEVISSSVRKISEEKLSRRLVAAISAYISVLYRGRVQIQIANGTAIVTSIDGESTESPSAWNFSQDANESMQLNLGNLPELVSRWVADMPSSNLGEISKMY